jgi:hypothetical protein
MKLCRNIHRGMWQLLGLKKIKMAAVAMVTKVSFSLLLLLLLLLFHTFLSARFLGDALIKLYETL